DHSLGLLEWLNQAIQEKAVKTAIVPLYIVLVVLVEGVHGRLPTAISAAGYYRPCSTRNHGPAAMAVHHARAQGISRAKPVASRCAGRGGSAERSAAAAAARA